MLGSIYVGLSGLNAFSKGLQTISNNVANLNSLGFKASTVNFTGIVNTGGIGSSFTRDGSSRAGTGVRFDSSRIDYGQGDLRQTGNDLDLAIDGSGFMVLLGGGKTYYARTGQFTRNDEGYIVDAASGHRLSILDGSRQPVAVNVDDKRTLAPIVTKKVTFTENLSSSGSEATISNIVVFDSAGGRHVWQVKLAAVGATAPGEWNGTVTDENLAKIGEFKIKVVGASIDSATAKTTITINPTGADELKVELDFSAVRSFSAGTSSTVRATSDGQGVGNLISVTIDADGKVKLNYSNQKNELLGSVALADFPDPQRLVSVGNGIFEIPEGSEVRYVASGSDGVGRLVSQQVEASNVDLSQQFGDLILIQRGFQASSQVVSVSNDMIQQLFGIRGQG